MSHACEWTGGFVGRRSISQPSCLVTTAQTGSQNMASGQGDNTCVSDILASVLYGGQCRQPKHTCICARFPAVMLEIVQQASFLIDSLGLLRSWRRDCSAEQFKITYEIMHKHCLLSIRLPSALVYSVYKLLLPVSVDHLQWQCSQQLAVQGIPLYNQSAWNKGEVSSIITGSHFQTHMKMHAVQFYEDTVSIGAKTSKLAEWVITQTNILSLPQGVACDLQNINGNRLITR